jgi:hypothetical protein
VHISDLWHAFGQQDGSDSHAQSQCPSRRQQGRKALDLASAVGRDLDPTDARFVDGAQQGLVEQVAVRQERNSQSSAGRRTRNRQRQLGVREWLTAADRNPVSALGKAIQQRADRGRVPYFSWLERVF